MFVLDESSKFKNTQTKRFKILRPFLPKFSQRLILTGSPAPNGLLDLFGQVYIMDLGRALGQYISHYRMKYFDSSGFGGYTWKIKPGADKLIEKQVKPYVMRMEAEDYIEMPELVEPRIEFDLPPSARDMYDNMEDDLFVALDAGESLTAPTAAAARTKCAQIANGAVYTNPEGLEIRGKYDFIEVHDEKLVALGDFLDERNGQPTLVFYYFQHDLIRIRKYLKKRFGWDSIPSMSEVTPSKGKALEDQWNRNEIPVLLGQPASVGHGLNMQEGQANHAVWFSLPDDFDTYDQANRRLRRSGNKNSHVFAHRIVARNTVDVAKGALLRRKGATQKDFLDAMKSYRRPRSNK
jgi:SNF2 family DNA or RNA helicase